MNNNRQIARLGDLLHRSTETIQPKPDDEYRELTVRLWGKGVLERGRVTGAEVSSRRFVAHAGDFIISRIDARHGASGLVPQSLDGALVTNDFPLFKIDNQKLDPRFFEWLTRTRGFVGLCKRASEGTTNRVRLGEERFLALEIPLPPLEEQQRLVARIEELFSQIKEARALRAQAAEENDALFEASVAHRFSKLSESPTAKLKNITTKVGSGSTPLGGRAAYPESGIPFIRSLNVRMRRFQWDDIVFISKETHENMRGTHVRPWTCC